MQKMHSYPDIYPLTKQKHIAYIRINTAREILSWQQGFEAMAKSFLRTAFDRVVEARERQVSRHVNAALLNLDDKSLEALGMNRAG